MPDTTNDIDALLRILNQGGCETLHAALTALVAERDELQSKIDSMTEAMHSIARRQVALEEEAEERQSIGLRERLLCAALTGVDVGGLHRGEVELLGKASVWLVDAAIAAMRKGATDGK